MNRGEGQGRKKACVFMHGLGDGTTGEYTILTKLTKYELFFENLIISNLYVFDVYKIKAGPESLKSCLRMIKTISPGAFLLRPLAMAVAAPGNLKVVCIFLIL